MSLEVEMTAEEFELLSADEAEAILAEPRCIHSMVVSIRILAGTDQRGTSSSE